MKKATLLLIVSLLLGCSTPRLPELLPGEWQSNIVKTEWGDMSLHCRFRSNHTVSVTGTYENQDDIGGLPAPYTVEDNSRVRAQVGKNEEFLFHFKNEDLWLTLSYFNASTSNMVDHTFTFKKMTQ